jgi:hypothetical protein
VTVAKNPFQDPPHYPAPSGQAMYAAHLLDPDGATVEVGFFAAASDDEAAKTVAGLLKQPPDWQEAVAFHLFREVVAKQ